MLPQLDSRDHGGKLVGEQVPSSDNSNKGLRVESKVPNTGRFHLLQLQETEELEQVMLLERD